MKQWRALFPSFEDGGIKGGFAASARGIACALALLVFPSMASAQSSVRVLDAFDDASGWQVVTSNQVSGKLRLVDGVKGKAVCLDYDFNGVSGYAGLRRELPIDYPDNYRFGFQLRGDSPRNDLQFKLVDASGDNVWWVNKPRYDFPREWTPVVYKRRHIDKAWGPGADPVLRKSARIEYTIYNSAGGKGSVCLDELTLETLPPDDTSPLKATAAATGTVPGSTPAHAMDGSGPAAWTARLPASLTLDLGSQREFGGLLLRWQPERHATAYRVDISRDRRTWTPRAQVRKGNGLGDFVALPESEARYVRITVEKAASDKIALVEARVEPLSFAATTNDLLKSIAASEQRGRFPRGFIGEQPYWTLVGIDGGHDQGLIGEDGAIELRRAGPSVTPFVQVTDPARKPPLSRWLSWADVDATQSLQDNYLPIPSVQWRHADVALRTTAFAQGEPGKAQLVGRYRLSNPTRRTLRYTLALALQPYQVNPPSQFLNTAGGYAPIRQVAVQDGRIDIDGQPRLYLGLKGDATVRALASDFENDLASMRLDDVRPSERPMPQAASDEAGLASAAWSYTVELAPGESREFSWVAPLEGDYALPADFDAERAQAAVAATWHDKLDRVGLRVPKQGRALADTLRTALAHMLISRIGPRLQPGTRSYSRSWVRDGAMISEGLMRLGREDVAREYVDWYAPFQFKDGMVPCCVDDRGSDPVPENDSHGELIYAIAEYYRYTGDRDFLRAMWPHVQGAFAYMEQLRASERTPANRAVNAAFYGMMPVSISHEGYSAKPVHSYWDNFWALRGYKDAAEMAGLVGTPAEQARMAAARDQFQADLQASLLAAVKQHGIDFLPGSAELGDFDATSTTIALAPGGEQGRLPADLLENTFQRYWTRLQQRRDGPQTWKDYTPYEWRNVAAFVRLGWRARAWEATEYFFGHRTPQAWNQWAEVISRTPREPFFVGDLPHAWVASDFVRSALDMFAYTREQDDSIVLAAGVPGDWLEGEGIAIDGLRSPQGPLAYSLRREDAQLRLEVKAGLRVPKGGLVLTWPYAGTPGKTTINGQAAQWRDGELRISSLPAVVVAEVR